MHFHAYFLLEANQSLNESLTKSLTMHEINGFLSVKVDDLLYSIFACMQVHSNVQMIITDCNNGLLFARQLFGLIVMMMMMISRHIGIGGMRGEVGSE